MPSLRLLTLAAAAGFAAKGAFAQTLPSGVINAPPTVIGDNQSIGSNTTLNVLEGGVVESGLFAGMSDRSSENVVVNVAGGIVGAEMRAYPGSTVNISGGSIGDELSVYHGSTVNLSGGAIGNEARVTYGALNVHGGEIGDDLFVGWSPNPFIDNDRTFLNLSGGAIGDRLVAYNTRVTISGGAIGADFYLGDGRPSTLPYCDSYPGNVCSVAHMTGGSVGAGFTIDVGSTLNLSGGTIGDNFAKAGLLNISGSEFSVDGAQIDLQPGLPLMVEERDVSLTGRLADGSSFDFYLDSSFSALIERSGDFFGDAPLTVTLVPDPGDYNGDGQVTAADYAVLVSRFGEEAIPYSYADGNGDGRIDAADYTVWRDNVAPTIAESLAEVPEPASVVLLELAAVLTTSRKRERPE